jgi:O-antigen/teichoic acid export membrane protein
VITGLIKYVYKTQLLDNIIMQAAKRVAVNTGFLYGKMLITMVIVLYSTRLVLDALGVDDFGIFNLVAGVISMLSFLNAAMATSTQRYMSFNIGARNEGKLNSVFRTSVILHLFIGIIIVILLEVVGLFLFNGFLNISENRIPTAKIVYQFMVISTFFTINAVPYDAAIIAHENLLFDAIVGVFESVLKLGIAIALSFSQNDRLILYGILMAVLIILIRIIKSIYCFRKFDECKFNRKASFDITLLKEMFSFASWNTFGALCGMGRNQGIAIILNVFFGTVVNAAYGIANQVNSQLFSFSSNMLKALNPQIIKSEGSGDRERMLYLSMVASKYGFFLLAIFGIPLIFEMPFVLKLWLNNVPEHTVIFCRLILIATLTNQLTIGLQTAIQSTGKIKLYQMFVGGIILLNLPIGWILLTLDFPAYSVIVSMIFIELLACISRIIFLNRIAGLSITKYFQNVIYKIAVPIMITVIIIGILYINLDYGYLRVILLSFVSTLVILISIYTTGLIEKERLIINRIFLKLTSNFKNTD